MDGIQRKILRAKICVVGECKVGKTALCTVFNKGKQYPKQYAKTLAMEFTVSQVKIPESDTTVELYLFDISGDDIYKKIRQQYYDGCNFVLCAYDVTDRDSFNKCKAWIQEAKASLKGSRKLQGVVVACKNDLRDFAQVRPESALELAHEFGFGYFETSAMLSDVDAPFNFLANTFHLMYQEKCRDMSEGMD